jgi:hypothetical protein
MKSPFRTVWVDGTSGRLEALSGLAGAGVVAAVALATAVVLIYGPDGSLPLVDAPLQGVVVALALAGLAVGVAGRSRRWWLTWGVGIVVAAAVVTAVAEWWLKASGLVDQHYPPTFALWVWGSLAALGVAVTGWWSGPAVVRVVRVVTVPIALFGSFLLINAHYGYWPTMGALLNRPVAGQVSAKDLARSLTEGGVHRVGSFGPVSIPGPAGFDAATAWVWIPPAISEVDRARVPVLVLMPGVPGRANDWAQAGQVVPLANAWAHRHGGIAPVMVLLNENGAHDRDTECVNGTQGAAETYLTRSVPSFIIHHLGITPDPARWGVVGFSEGGTCALGLATDAPHIYGRFVDIAGDLAPNFGKNTLIDLYAGNTTEAYHHQPRWLFAHRRYPHLEGWFAASSGDRSHVLIARELTRSARAAGVTAFDASGQPGGHSWSYARTALWSLYPALVESMPTPPVASGTVSHRRLFVADPGRAHHRST